MKTLYLECQSGISGDMTVAALLDLGADADVLQRGLDSLGVSGYSIKISKVEKSGITASDFDVVLQQSDHNHEADHECCGGKGHGEKHEHAGEHEHAHEADHECCGGKGHGEKHEHAHDGDHECCGGKGHGEKHEHRSLPDISAIITGSSITERAKSIAIRIFTIVAQAESVVHGKPVDEVHFHEVGAIDSIVDIVGAAICFDNLGIERVVCTALKEGCGTVKCQHGVIPVPAPATLEISRAHGIPLNRTDIEGELVTPTGAAIVAAITDSFSPIGAGVVEAVGYGAGKRDYIHTANVLRASIIRVDSLDESSDTVCKLECNIDDMTGETLAFACEKLMQSGALDVWCTPILMKKGRPAQLLSVLCSVRDEKKLVECILANTSTLGVRTSSHCRHIMKRRLRDVQTVYGNVTIKESSYGDICKTQIEYESAKTLANAEGVPINEIFRAAYSKLNP